MLTEIWGAGEAKIKVLADLVPSEGPLPGFYTATSTLRPHMAEKGNSGLSSSCKGIDPFIGTPHS